MTKYTLVRHHISEEYMYLKEEPCTCRCHQINTLHMFPCCDNGIKKRYISIEAYNKLITDKTEKIDGRSD